MTLQVLFLGFVPLFVPQNSPVLTLDEALKIAETQAFDLRVAKSQAESAKAQVKVTEADLYPSAKFSATTTYADSKTTSGFGQNGSYTNTNLSLTASKIIDISGIYRNQILAARYSKLAQDANVAVTKNTLRGDVKAAFFAVVQSKEQVDVAEAAKTASEARLSKARIQEQEGSIPRFDVLRLEVDLKKAEQDLSDAKGNYVLAKQQLNNTIGRPIETEFEVEAQPVIVAKPDEAAAYVATALKDRPEIQKAQLGIKALEESRKATEKAAAPSLSVGASYGRNVDPGFGQPNETTSASITFSLPITVPGVVSANSKTAQESENQAKIQYEQLQLGVALQVQQALTSLNTALEAYDTALKNEELATEALRLAQLRYDEKVGILLDVTTSQTDLTQAQSNVAAAAYRVRSAYAALQQAVGTDDLTHLDTPGAPADKTAEEKDKK